MRATDNNDDYLVKRLKRYRIILHSNQNELRTLPEGSLGFRSTASGTEYVHLFNEGSDRNTYIRKGITKNPVLIARLARKKYLQVSNKLLKREIELLEKYLRFHTEPTSDNILGLLPAKFGKLPREMFFPNIRNSRAWQNKPYEQSTYKPHEKIHVTSKGLRVRSKSEVIIAELLDAWGIPYRYEMLIHFEGKTYCPDFTININGKIFYWEHCGLMSDPDYRSRNLKKLRAYQKMGIVPWNNLIITYDTEDGAINSSIIEAEIRNKLVA